LPGLSPSSIVAVILDFRRNRRHYKELEICQKLMLHYEAHAKLEGCKKLGSLRHCY
jgi:hypothetical protein